MKHITISEVYPLLCSIDPVNIELAKTMVGESVLYDYLDTEIAKLSKLMTSGPFNMIEWVSVKPYNHPRVTNIICCNTNTFTGYLLTVSELFGGIHIYINREYYEQYKSYTSGCYYLIFNYPEYIIHFIQYVNSVKLVDVKVTKEHILDKLCELILTAFE